MSRIGKSVANLVRGNFLRTEKKCAKVSPGAINLKLAESGIILRKNILKNMIIDIQQQPVAVQKLQSDSYSKLQQQFGSLILKKNILNEEVIIWENTETPLTFLYIPPKARTEDLHVHISDKEYTVKENHKKDLQPNNIQYSLDVSSFGDLEIKNSPIILYTLLPLHSERGKWTFAYQDFLRTRRKWWKQYFFNPSSIEVTETDPRTEAPKAAITANFEGQNFDLSNNLTLETIRMLDKCEVPELTIESEVGEGPKKLVDAFKIVETCCYISNGCVALLLDSVRKRLFLKSTRLALDRNIVPYKVAICCAESLSTEEEKLEMNMLKCYLQKVLDKNEVNVFDYEKLKRKLNDPPDFFNDYEAADAYGVPHLIVITSDSLKDGVIHIRDREVRII